MSSKYTDFFETGRKEEKNQNSKKTKQVSFDDSYSLPKHVKSRESVEKGFKEYLSHKEEDRRRGYISPPFEASKVPSPIYGYHKPKKEKKPFVDYYRLKEEMKKETRDLILYEEFLTEELENEWQKETAKDETPPKKAPNRKQGQTKIKKLTRKAYGLNRTLESIMEEEKSGNNRNRRNVPGLFENKKDL
ncbi:hypothetical protein SAMN04488102_10146 [Alkalibacterium subtropicum]|uniref:Uncharacterized protein n=1 Tax=Alkalibacterium subtropicum TaxID=753702 RepID=A0A1I1EF97_9LACT|nr:hypothetical protein [Alkalibacterium subtropicum]SFB83660.1 hypothetical protein SAMN04488102_10146 [Alkalibacterium subtropicum]